MKEGFFLSTLQLLGCLELPLLGFSSWFPSDRLSNCFFSALKKDTNPVSTETNQVYVSDVLKQV